MKAYELNFALVFSLFDLPSLQKVKTNSRHIWIQSFSSRFIGMLNKEFYKLFAQK